MHSGCTTRAQQRQERCRPLIFALAIGWILIFPLLSVVLYDDTLSFTFQRLVGFNTNTSYIILSLPVLYLYDGLLVPSVV